MAFKLTRHLSGEEQKYEQMILRYIESYQTEWTFSGAQSDVVGRIYHKVLREHPEYFWLSGQYHGTIRTLGFLSTLTLIPTPEGSAAQIANMRRQLEHITDVLIASAKRHSSVLYEQILFLHDYLVIHTDYKLGAPHCYDAYGCLVLHSAACAGYAAAFQLLMGKLGVECGRVSGWSSSARTGEVPHAWNYIKLSDGYYFVDVTWDDPIIQGGAQTDNLSHDFFCIDLQELLLTHTPAEDQFMPHSYGKAFNYYLYRGWYLERYSFPAVRALAIRQLQHSDAVFLKFGTKSEAERAKKDLIDSHRVFSIPGLSRGISYSVSKSGFVLHISRK